MHLVQTTIDFYELAKMAGGPQANMIKGVLDVRKGTMVLGADKHADAVQFLAELGSYPEDVWGFTLDTSKFGTPAFIAFEADINVRPAQNNRSLTIEDEKLRATLAALITQKIIA